jgi:maltooligosyltrehalose synthase
VVVVGRLLLALGAANHAPVGGDVWGDTSLVLESRLATRTFRDAFTGLAHHPVPRDRRGQLPLAEVFGHLPLALLEADV